MSAQVGRASAPGSDPRPDPGSMEAFATLFDAYARNVFDYCSSLLDDQAEADAATRVTLIAACTLVEGLDSRFRLRPWLLALARAECNSKHPGRAEPLPSDGLGFSELISSWQREDDEIVVAGPGELMSDVETSEGLEGPVLAVLSALPVLQRETLELVYRHGVRPAELPAILRISADRAQTELADAVTSFEHAWWSAAGPDKGVGSRQLAIEQLSSLPLASLPASLWRRTFRAVFDPDAGSYRDAVAARLGPFLPDGFPRQETQSVDPSGKRLVLASLLLGVMLLTPAAAGAVLYSHFSGSPDALVHSHGGALTPTSSADPASPLQSGPHRIRVHRHRTHVKVHSFVSPFPAEPNPAPSAPKPWRTSPSPRITNPGPSSSPSPTKHPSPSSTPSGTPSPTPTTPSPTPSPSS